ncbi:hypothetical protein LIER_38503 [Lithospermum erythrorhizon]|uniref:Uncharacterized protein n=1 Tax=Lithospermum erythrorhizon TaxID=34254 RepID=A0AAV3Q353_LITER
MATSRVQEITKKHRVLKARISTSMEDILQRVKRPEHYNEGIVFPHGVPWNATYNDSLLVVQLNHYDCGGKSLSISMSHKPNPPCFTGASIVPPDDSVTKAEFEREAQTEDQLLTRRFSFDDSNLSKFSDAFVEDTFDNANKVKRLKGLKDYGYYNCSSFRGYPPSNFDFGWGKPNKVFVGPKPIENFFILTDDPDRDAVEAMETLDKQNMSVFEGEKLLENAMED